jgi:magnesium chelatase family protein
VAEARSLAASRAHRAGDGAAPLNSRAEGAWLETIAALDPTARALLVTAAEANAISARGWTRTLRLARTIADLDRSDDVRRVHVAEALIYRRALPGSDGGAARPGRFDWRGAIGARA